MELEAVSWAQSNSNSSCNGNPIHAGNLLSHALAYDLPLEMVLDLWNVEVEASLRCLEDSPPAFFGWLGTHR
ncbi:unnamed protein product [Spirodela intermedia]|uniref:Uncharacterized protein n=1 Tax=Spirodela intermedia TaxID=51605 RepID=A0A7I8KTZ6_SPIIN|nr:unnamed protein product [Spirodela intermedia]